ncbi:MAG: hypothetical protein AAF731_17810 [Bacteroidota bacterium]
MKEKVKFKVYALAFLVGVTMISCSDDDIESITIEITEEEVADIIAATLSEEDGGFASDIDNLILDIEEECGYTEIYTLNESEIIGVRSFSVDYEMSLEVKCNDSDELLEIAYMFTSDREAELIRLDVTSFAEGDWSFKDNGQNYLMDGSYTYEGEEQFKVKDENMYNSTLSYASNNLTINEDGDFLTGELTIDYVANSTSGESRQEDGVLTITEVNTGLFDVSSFEFLYEINLKTGEVEKIER